MKTWSPMAGLALMLLTVHTLEAQAVTADKPSLAFTAQVNGPPTSLPLNVNTTPAGAIVLATPVQLTGTQVTWLSVSPSGGSTPLPLAVTVDPSKLPIGTYTGSVVISVFGGSNSVTVPVTLTVSTINVFPPSLTFEATVGNTPLVQSVTLVASQQINFTATASTVTGGSWLHVSPDFGTLSPFGAVTALPDAAVVPLLSPGTYRGTITITPTTGSSTTPVQIPVTLNILPAPAVTVTPSTVNLLYQIGGTANVLQKNLSVTTPSAQGVAFTITTAAPANPSGGVWVGATPTSGTATPAGAGVTVGYSPNVNLPAGAYTGTVTVNTPNGSPAKTDVPVTLTISSLPLLSVPITPLSFTYQYGGNTPVPQTITVTSTSTTAANFTVTTSTTDGAAWLTAPSTGSTASPLSVSINPSVLAPGTYSGTVRISGVGTGNGEQRVPVTLKVNNDPAITVDIPSLSLAYQHGQTQLVSQAIAVSSSNGIPLNYTVTSTPTNCGSSWLPVATPSGVTPGKFSISVSSGNLVAGICTASIAIAATNAITGVPAINSPLIIPVNMIVSSGPVLLVSPLTPASFTTEVGGGTPTSRIFTFNSSSSDPLNYSVTTATDNGSTNWLQASQSNGQTSTGVNQLAVSVSGSQLQSGTYTGRVTVAATAPGGGFVANSPLVIPVKFIITGGSLSLDKTSLTFKQALGGAVPATQAINITSTLQPLNYAVSTFTSGAGNWLTATIAGVTPGTISVSVDGSKLALGSYTGAITVLATTPNSGNSPVTIPVTLQINAGSISAAPSPLTFSTVEGGPNPSPQILTISGSPGSLPFQLTTGTTSGGSTWLSAAASGGTTPANVQIRVSPGNLPVGSYSGTITISSTGADGSPLTVPVTFNVIPRHDITLSQTIANFTASPGSTASQSTQLQLNAVDGAAPFSVFVSGETWFSITPTTGSTPATLTLTVNPSGLAAGAYSGSFTVTSPNASSPLLGTVNLVIGNAAKPVINAAANAASYSTGTISPGENIVIFGSGIGPASLTKGTVTNGIVDTTLAATRVLFDGIPSPILYALSAQTSVMVPYALAGHATTSVVVEYQGVQSEPVAYNLLLAAPGIYTQNAQGSGPGAILNQDYRINLPGTPAAKGSVVAVYMTGEGFIFGAVDGQIATGLLSPVLEVTATVGGLPATVIYAGTAPGIITGALQVNVRIPDNAPSGPSVPIVITLGSGPNAANTQPGVTVAIQ